MVYKILKFIVEIATVITAIIYTIVQNLSYGANMYETMIMGLLCLIATSSILEDLDGDRKWKDIRQNLSEEISSIVPCRIITYSNSIDWIMAMKELTKNGKHTQDTASLDSSTRSKAKKNHDAIWNYINECCKDCNTTYRHIVRIRKNNFDNLLNRILSGSANKNTYFAYYELDTTFSFPTFGIIDNRYVSTRSPYKEGEQPCYMIIESKQLVEYYNRYFLELWTNAKKIDSVQILENLFNLLKDQYSDEENISLQEKINRIKREGIIDDI